MRVISQQSDDPTVTGGLPLAMRPIRRRLYPRHGIESCRSFANINFVSELPASSYDALVCTDKLSTFRIRSLCLSKW